MKKWFVIIGIVIVLVVAYLITMAALNGQVRAAYAARKAAGQPTTLAELPRHKDLSNGKASGLLAEAQNELAAAKGPANNTKAALGVTQDTDEYALADSGLLDPAAVKSLLARNAHTIELLLAASQQPRQSLFPNLEEGAEAKIETTLHSWPRFFALLHAQSRDLLAQNKADEAMDVCLAGLRITDLLAADQMALYALVQFRFDRATMAVMQEVAPHCSDAALARAAGAVAGLRADKDLVPAWSAEAIMFTGMLEKTRMSELAMWSMDNGPGAFYYMFPPTNRLSLIEYSKSVRRSIELSAQPWYKTRSAWDSMDAAVRQMKARRSPLTFVYLGEPKMIPGRVAQYQAVRAVTLAGLRLLQYERSHAGTPPAELSAVGTDFGIDPYTGKPPAYRVEGKGFKLYSVGADLKDDGGDPKTDIVWKE